MTDSKKNLILTDGSSSVKKLILTDRANFADIRQLGGVYIDKTKAIYDCMGTGTYFFLSRPRRFGKSLLCSTLKEMFSGNKELFKGLWLYDSDWRWNNHPVVHLDMTFIAGKNNTVTSMREKLDIQLEKITKFYAIDPIKVESTSSLLDLLVTRLYEKTGQKVVVIIDEYDKPILDLVDDPVMRNEAHAILRDFYAPLKPLEAHLRFVLLTGVYKFMQTSIFSNLNNLTDLTFATKAGTLLGYTQEEVESCFSEEIDALAFSLSLDRVQMLERLREQYNGYRFGVNIGTGELSPGVYNPFGLNHTFKEIQLFEKWFESGSPAFLIKKIAAGNFKDIEPKGLDVMFSDLKNSCSPDEINAISLLYYAGYATMGRFTPGLGEVKLVFPNLEVAQATSKELINIFKAGNDSDLFKIAWSIGDCFRNHQLDNLKDLFNQALAQLTYQTFESKENYFQLMVVLILNMGKLRANAEIPTNDGRMDIVVELQHKIFIVELKFNQPAADGLQQIKDKDYAKKFKTRGLPMIAVGLSIAIKDNENPRAQLNNKNCVIDVAVEALI